jgi:murein DD-endopeptidase MepM/ murein hydrolase activator NlpD
VTYRAYIKKDYKPEIRWVPDRCWHQGRIRLVAGLISSIFLLGAYSFYPGSESKLVETVPIIIKPHYAKVELPDNSTGSVSSTLPIPIAEESFTEIDVVKVEPSPWQKVDVKKCDNLSTIFDRIGLGPRVLFQVMSAGRQTHLLKNLLPGNSLNFLIDDGQLQTLKFEPDLVTSLEIVKQAKGYSSEIIITELDIRTNESGGSIDSSLFLAGQDAGLSDNLIMQLVSIFGWDIDFALDIRKGDKFNVIYEEKYKDNIKVGEGAILAAEFVNRNQSFRTVRYTSPNGDSNYFNQDGVSMRKAFLRTPLNFSRISSRFNLSRKHPVLNRIRAHRGVDYAAPTGTPIKAAGDGTVVLAGRNGGYGRTVILKHGGNRSTLYAHMSSFSKKMRRGKKVKQGQIIGYVGKSGLATGPHLHYEFRVHGVHRNPLTVKLPKASGIPKKYLANFKQETASLLANLDNSSDIKFAQQKTDDTGKNNIIALGETNSANRSVQ